MNISKARKIENFLNVSYLVTKIDFAMYFSFLFGTLAYVSAFVMHSLNGFTIGYEMHFAKTNFIFCVLFGAVALVSNTAEKIVLNQIVNKK